MFLSPSNNPKQALWGKNNKLFWNNTTGTGLEEIGLHLCNECQNSRQVKTNRGHKMWTNPNKLAIKYLVVSC